MTVEIFSDMDELVEVGRRLGYNGGGSQLKPGALRIHRQSHSIGEIAVVRHSAIGAVDYWGDPPGGHVTFIVPLKIEGYRVNLESPRPEEVVLLPPANEIAFTTHGHDQYIVYVPVRLLERHLGDDYSSMCSSFSRVRRLKINQYRRQQLIALLTDSSLGGGHDANPCSLEHQICEALAALVHAQEMDDCDTLRGSSRMKAIRRARDFIMANMDTPLTMSSISNAAGVSERTLQRLFKGEFQLAPVQYIKAQRLEAVRRALIQHNSDIRSISKLAAEHGFGHLGRFSMEFKQQFGSLPKEFRRESLLTKAQRPDS